MSDIKAPIISEQTAPQPQPTYANYQPTTGTEEWSNGIFDCFKGADNLCLKATFCSCFVYGRTQARLRDPSLTGYERINNDCLLFAGLNCVGAGFVLEFLKRQDIRAKYSIRGDPLSDALLSFCCGCCSLIQGEKEVIGRAQAHAQTQGSLGYQAPAGMHADPQ
ncbi:hypothetical protein LZ554_004265 [Drepanopeziza brunnea f. sp. 'monogermtubi']|nr:hypothetical protein LZ554_004265 [Drepanopeziza brunnea f. sp. 'monogermtubi']